MVRQRWQSNNVIVNPTILTRIITRTCLLDFLARLTKCLRKRKIIKKMYKEQNSNATIKSIMSIKWFIPQPNEIMTNRKISLFSWFFSAASNWTKHHDDSFSTFLMLYGLYCSMMSVRMIPLNFFVFSNARLFQFTAVEMRMEAFSKELAEIFEYNLVFLEIMHSCLWSLSAFNVFA